MTDRRRFLQLIGIGTASAPLAAKAAFDTEAAALTALRGAPAIAASRDIEVDHLDPEERKVREQAVHYVKMFGRVPEHIDERIVRGAQYVRWLDPDIACKRSWSLAVKIMTQRERNVAHARAQHTEFDKFFRAQRAFAKLFGFEWPW